MTTYYVDQLLPGGKRQPLTWAGKHTGGSIWLAAIQHHARHHRMRILVGVIQSKRDLACAIARRYAANHADWQYAEVRPIPLQLIRATGGKPGSAIKRTDCSGSCKAIAYAAGYPDPTGRGYDGWGNTEDFTAHAQRHGLAKTRARARHGDFATFLGALPHQHEILLLEDVHVSPDPLVFSFGSPGGPRILRLSQEESAHPGQALLFQDAGV